MQLFLISLLLACAVLAASTTPYSFITLGDWGGAALGGQDYDNVYAVAKQMAETAKSVSAEFILNVGDNFYWCGIQNTSDFQIGVDYEQPYSDPSLSSISWYSILGNHE